MYRKPKYLLVVLAFMSCSTLLSGQFNGGPSDGFYKSGNVQITLNGVQVNVAPLYQGGNGDGADKVFASTTLAGESLFVLYGGGSDDGFDKEQIAVTMDGFTISSLYSGGDGDGNDKEAFQGVLNGAMIAILYGGGDSDGHDKSVFNGIMDGSSINGLYAGGFGDGADKDFANVTLDGTELSDLYGGGDGDGFNKDQLNTLMDGTPLAILYTGGDGDGFSKSSVQYIFAFPGCTFVVNGDDDGFGSLRYAIDCAAPGDTITFSPLLLHQNITITSTELAINKDVAILSDQIDDITVDAAGVVRGFYVASGQEVEITGLKIIAGSAQDGAGVYNNGFLTLLDVTIIDANSSQSALLTAGTAQLTIQGECRIVE